MPGMSTSIAWPGRASGPIIQEALSGRADRVATYQDLLKSPHDEALFEYHMQTQLTLVDAASGRSGRMPWLKRNGETEAMYCSICSQ